MNEKTVSVVMNNKTVIQKEEAQKQLDLFCGFYDIDPDFIPPGQQTQFEEVKLKLLKHIMRGRVEIKTEAAKVIVLQHLINPVGTTKTLKYKEFNGKARMEADKGEGVTEKVNFLLGSLSGGGAAELEKFTGIDPAVAECVGTIFFVV